MATRTHQFLAALTMAAALSVVTGSTTGSAAQAEVRTIRIFDQCDPETFNAMFGPDTCVGNAGGIKLDVFISQLMHHGAAGAWHFTPDPLRLNEDEEFIATNFGGEEHTFTEVDEFGGGFVKPLNDILGLTPTPECAAIADDLTTRIQPGESTDPEEEEPGVTHYQCCIHPWMRTDIIVR